MPGKTSCAGTSTASPNPSSSLPPDPADVVRLTASQLAAASRLPDLRMIPAEGAPGSSLALRLWPIEPKGRVVALAARGSTDRTVLVL